MNSYFPFELTSRFLQPTPRVVVLSDSDYKKYQAEQAEKELLVLPSKKNRLEAADFPIYFLKTYLAPFRIKAECT